MSVICYRVAEIVASSYMNRDKPSNDIGRLGKRGAPNKSRIRLEFVEVLRDPGGDNVGFATGLPENTSQSERMRLEPINLDG